MKLKKGGGMHYDLLVQALALFISALLGLPYTAAAPVRAFTMTRALTVFKTDDQTGKLGVAGVIENRAGYGFELP